MTYATELRFGFALRAPRRCASRRAAWRPWASAIGRSALLAITVIAPLATVASYDDLSRVRESLFPAPAYAAPAWTAPSEPRPVVPARRLITTVTAPEPPAVTAHVVAQGETLLGIAARFGIAPQTLAYDNGISDSAQLRVGESLLVPPFDAAIHVIAEGESLPAVATRYGLDADAVRALNGVAFDDSDVAAGRLLILPVPDAQYPGFRLRLSEPPRVLAPRVRWPAEGVITQLFTPAHTGVDIAAPSGTAIVATDAGTVSFVGWRGDGGLAVCIYHDWGLETCVYHTSTTLVDVGQRVTAGQRIAAIGLTGVTTGPHVHWETRTNGALVDPMTYATYAARPVVGGSTGTTSSSP